MGSRLHSIHIFHYSLTHLDAESREGDPELVKEEERRRRRNKKKRKRRRRKEDSDTMESSSEEEEVEKKRATADTSAFVQHSGRDALIWVANVILVLLVNLVRKSCAFMQAKQYGKSRLLSV